MNVSRGQRKKQQVKSLTMGFDGLLPVVQWLVIVRLNQIEEVALGSLESGKDAPGMEEAMEAILRIFEGRPEEAEERDYRGVHESRGHGVVAGVSRTPTPHPLVRADRPTEGGMRLSRRQAPP